MEGIRFAINHGGRALIGDEMGCGKTLQAIGILQHYRSHWPALILVPVSLMTQWHQELRQFCAGLLADEDIFVVRKATDIVGGKVCIVSYSIVERLVQSGKLQKVPTHNQF